MQRQIQTFWWKKYILGYHSSLFSDYNCCESDERSPRCQPWTSGIRHLGGVGCCCSPDDYIHRLLCLEAGFGKDHVILRDILYKKNDYSLSVVSWPTSNCLFVFVKVFLMFSESWHFFDL